MAFFKKKQSIDMPPRRRQLEGQTERRQSSVDEGSILFRRNRTLTGSSSSGISSVNEQSGALKSARVHAHELMDVRRRIGGILLLVSLVIVIVGILLSQFTNHVVVSVGNVQGVNANSYMNTIQTYLDSHPFERLRFALNVQNLADYVRSKDPEVASITEVRSDGFTTTLVAIQLRTALVGWQMADKQYFVDQNGVSFTKNYGTAPTVEIIDRSGVQLQPGSAVISTRFLSYVGRTVALAQQRQLVVQQVVIPLGTTHEIELHIKGYSYPARLSIDRPVGEQVEDMARTIAYFQQKGMSPQYIDVRVSGKAYYR